MMTSHQVNAVNRFMSNSEPSRFKSAVNCDWAPLFIRGFAISVEMGLEADPHCCSNLLTHPLG